MNIAYPVQRVIEAGKYLFINLHVIKSSCLIVLD